MASKMMKRMSLKKGKKDKKGDKEAAPSAPPPVPAASSAMGGPGTPEEKVKGWFKSNPGESPAPPTEGASKKQLVFNDEAAMSVGPDDSVSQVARGEVQGVKGRVAEMISAAPDTKGSSRYSELCFSIGSRPKPHSSHP